MSNARTAALKGLRSPGGLPSPTPGGRYRRTRGGEPGSRAAGGRPGGAEGS
jgi:hypothetical protein